MEHLDFDNEVFFYAIIHLLGRFLSIFHTPDGYARPIHLNDRFFHAALPAAIPFNDSSLKRNPLEGDIPGSGGEVAVVVATVVALLPRTSSFLKPRDLFVKSGRQLYFHSSFP